MPSSEERTGVPLDLRAARIGVSRQHAGQAHALVNQYDMVAGEWTRLQEESDAAGEITYTVKDVERYSEALESLAHEFAAFVRDVFGED